MRLGCAAGSLVILALVLGTTACGDAAKKRQAAAAASRADAIWRSGLTGWHSQMLGALTGISLLLSTQRQVELLHRADPKTDAQVDGFDRTLAGCSTVIHALGPVPADLVDARRSALRACASLETGAHLVEAAVTALQHGRGSESFNLATDPLSAGQNEMDVAVAEALRAASP